MAIKGRYRPQFMSLTPMEKMKTKELLEYDYIKTDTAEIDFIARAEGSGVRDLLTRRVGAYFAGDAVDINPEELDIGGFEITYSFPHYARNNRFPLGVYGSGNFSYRTLYEFLCVVYNESDYFIDSYLDGEFKQSAMYERFKSFRKSVLERMAVELREKKGKALRSTKGYPRLPSAMEYKDVAREYERMFGGWKDFKLWQDGHFQREIDDIGQGIRDAIINALSTGQISLRKEGIAVSTAMRRMKLDLDPTRVFYASGRLIEHLNIYIGLDREAA